MAVLLSGTTIGGHVAVHANNISTYALTSVPSNVITTSGGQTIGGTTYFSGGESLNLYGIRGRFTNEYIHLYNKVGIGHPSGWGEGQGNTPVYGLSTYGGINVGYGYDGQAVFNTYTRINYNWGGGTYGTEAFTIRGTYPSIALRSTTHDNKWLIHNASNLQYYYGASVDNNDWGKKIEFATDGNIWSSYYNDWLSNIFNSKQNASTAITTSNIGSQSVNYANSAGTAGQVSGVSISGSEANALKTTLGVTSLPYSVDITVNGDADKFYAVQFWGGDQDVWRRIIIKRGYSEPAPWDPIGTGVHHGGLLLDWEGNFGGWGGAEYADRLRVFNESYTNVCADMFIWSHSMGYVFMLRGGGALYHLHSDQAINGYYQSGSPDILYSTSTLSYDDTWSGTNVYDVPAPAPLSLDQVNSTRIDGLRTKKQSLLDGRYQQLSTAINTSNIGSQSVSYATSAGSATTAGSLTSMNISQFTNNSGYLTSYTETDTLATVTGRGNTTSNSVRFGSHVDLSPTASAFRFYDGTTFRGGFGLDSWGHSGSDANLVLYVEGDNTLFFSTSGTKRASLSSSAFNSLVTLQQNGNAVIHAGNIGSQSVNYASSAGNADTVDGYHESSFFRDNQDRTLSVLRFTGVGGDSGNSTNHGYAIYQGGGGWSHPYPDLHIGYHTGIKIGANTGYGGIRFYNDSTMETILFSVGDGDANVRVANTLHIGDTSTGLYLEGNRLRVRSTAVDNVVQFATYGMYLPQTGQTAGLYVESPIEARGGLRIGSDASAGTITVGADTAVAANRLVQRDVNGYIYANHINFSTPETENPAISSFITSNGDGWSRKSSLAHVRNQLGNYGSWITKDDRAYPRRADGDDINFYWDGQGGQPTWLWGSNNGTDFYVWNPSNFSVNYATSAGNSATTSQRSFDYIYGTSYLESAGAVFGTIFYDNNDRSYYVDPNSNSYLSTLRIADASGGVSLSVGNGSTHGVYTADNARKYLVVAADYYPHMALVASGANNTNHGAVFSFVGSEGGSFRQWNIGIPNNNPFIFSIGYNRTGDANPHYGVGDGWSSEDYNHARLSIDRDGNTKIRGMLYVNGTSGGISTGSAVIHAGNIGSQSVSNATTAGGLAVHTGRNNEANKIVRTQENGYVFFGYINSSSGNENNNSNPDRVWGTNGSDDYLRTYRTSALSVGYAASAGSASTASVAEFQSIPDARGNAYTPNDYTGNRIWWHFNNKDTVGGYGTYWHAIQTVSPWSSYDPSHRQQQIQWGGTDISFRYATSGTTWSSWYRFITDNNIGSQSVSYADESGYSGSTGSVEWTNVNSRPTALSQFTNDSGFITSSGSISGNAATANGANGNFYIDDNYGNTIVGVYTSTRYQGVFAMGDAYKLPADGTSTGSLYGLAWSHPNAGGVAGNLNTHGLLVMENGTFLAAISGSIRSRDDMRAPIFYDSNNTNYYVDPASGSNLYGGNGSFVIQGTWPQLRIAQNDGTPDASINYDAGDGYRKWNVGPGAGEAEGNEFGFAIYEGTRGTLYSTPLRINALTGYVQIGDRDNPAYQLDVSGYGYFRDNIGIATTPRSDGYKISMGGSIHLNGNSVDYVGSLYLEGSGTGGHLQPNAGSYGTLQITGSKNSWGGLRFTHSNVTLMMNSNESGHHNDSYGWQFRWENGTLYCHKNSYGGGTSATVLDSSNWTSYITVPASLVTGNTSSASINTSKFNIYNDNFTEAPVILQMNGREVIVYDRMNYVTTFKGEATSSYQMQITEGGINFTADFGGWAPITCEFVSQVSDINLKHYVSTIQSPIEKVKQLRGVDFLWKKNNQPSIGFIAQEVEEVLPVAVGNVDGTKTVDYSKIIPVLTEAIKEQQTIIEQLMARIEALENK